MPIWIRHSTSAAANGVLSNDFDSYAQILTTTGATNATNGTVTLNADGSFDYTPNPGFIGVDTFTYMATNGTTTSSAATVTINVLDTKPAANDDMYTTNLNYTA